jgi:hypothetical protein
MDAAVSKAEPARVLVVENFGQLREMLVDELVIAGFAADGADSMRQARRLHPERIPPTNSTVCCRSSGVRRIRSARPALTSTRAALADFAMIV